ncbi:MAG TPA: zinc ABC transporter solute-binding protein [Chloroflexi bacterium]|jgi:zinc transport system substrate-binding protein|nr:zinc ABC transporter substrate-binding protein [Anaerolineaceae bacterium]HHX08398.1 zinc ABC transporter solute-binding protein [Chloroflexota bacterium]
MKKILALGLLISVLLSACATTPSNQEPVDLANKTINVSVSIPPIEWLVRQIGADKIQVQSLTVSGDDPHTYEPSPSQMASLAKADLFLTVGVEFENVWVPRFLDANKNLQVFDISEGVMRLPTPSGHIHEGEAEAAGLDEEGLDPHIWLSPSNMELLAANTAAILTDFDQTNADFYQTKLNQLLEVIKDTDAKIHQLLDQPARAEFLILHPALGYLAHEYGLEMIPVEIEGQEPSPAQMAEILEFSIEYGITTLFVQKGSNPLNVQSLADQTKIESVIEIDPMAYDWDTNILAISEALSEAIN